MVRGLRKRRGWVGVGRAQRVVSQRRAVDAHMEMESEARPRQKALLTELGVGEDETREAREATPFEIEGERIDSVDHRGVAGNVTEFDGNLGLVIGAGGGSLTLFDAVRHHGGNPANYCEIGATRASRRRRTSPSSYCRSPASRRSR